MSTRTLRPPDNLRLVCAQIESDSATFDTLGGFVRCILDDTVQEVSLLNAYQVSEIVTDLLRIRHGVQLENRDGSTGYLEVTNHPSRLGGIPEDRDCVMLIIARTQVALGHEDTDLLIAWLLEAVEYLSSQAA